MSVRLNPRLLDVPLYVAGRPIQEVAEELGLEEVTKLASNESPIGPSPLAVQAAKEALRQAHRYPGTAERDLRRRLAAHLGRGLGLENILIGNGGTEVLHLLTQAFVFDGGNTIMGCATFPMYHISTVTFGGTPRQVPERSDYRFDLPAMAEAIDEDTRLVYLCSPNNPTGLIVTQAEADEFLARVPDHVVVVFDEAYHEYVTDPTCADSLGYVLEGRNVFVVRSFSKSAGLANLRVGYAIGPAPLVEYVRHAQLPFHSGAVALRAAAASLDDAGYLERNRRVVVEGRRFLRERLQELGLSCLSSQANFLTVLDPPMGAPPLAEALLRRGFIVRPLASFGLPNAIRVTVGSARENEAFIAALTQVLAEAGATSSVRPVD